MTPTSHLPVKPQKIRELFPDAIISKIFPAPEDPRFNYDGFKPGRRVLEAGHVRYPGRRPFGVRTIYERDHAIAVRDGAHLYADILRPESSDTQPVPCILPWSPYGKTGTGPQDYDFMAPYRAGIALDRTSGYEKFETPDPAEWAERGYAVLNIDARCAGRSAGVIARWGIQEAEDVYDVIDWLSIQPWCNGSVVMAGNSWLAISQINFASRMHHPALKAIAPWEGYTDLYRHFVARGGRPHIPGFHRIIYNGLAGREGVENVVAMLEKRPLYDDYSEAKRIPVENSENIPMHVVASYSSMLHTYGLFQTFSKPRQKRSGSVSIRIKSLNIANLLTDKDTNWELSTPRVRLSLLGFESDGSSATTVIERSEEGYPLARQRLRTLYLDGTTGKLMDSKTDQENIKSYEGWSLDDGLTFTTTFDVTTELAGYPKTVLHISCADHDDFDIVVQIRKIDTNGHQLSHLNYPCPVPIDEVPDVNTAKTLGPQGFLGASHSVSLNRDGGPVAFEDLSRETDVLHSHRVRHSISPGTIVRLEIPIWPIGMVFAAGEGIALNVSGHDMCLSNRTG
ncbi:cocaine esterase [Fusarium sp. NRRL 52700]|nr:cocaine esterase [Fusarium sp. NRRL 52700]